MTPALLGPLDGANFSSGTWYILLLLLLLLLLLFPLLPLGA
jgi:hypothetical protein